MFPSLRFALPALLLVAATQSPDQSSAVPTPPSAAIASSTAADTDRLRLPRCQQIAALGQDFEPLAETCDFALNTTGTLPDFIAQETIKRFSRVRDSFPWKDLDMATAEVRFEGGKVEHYSDFHRNGKPFPIPPDLGSVELGEFLATKTGGLWSLSVFGGQLRFVFASSTDAKFTYVGTTRVGETQGITFKFRAEALPYGWLVSFLDERIQVPTEGSVWIDGSDSRHIQFELHKAAQSSDAPDFSIDNEYGPVSIGDMGVFQLPVKNEAVSCAPKTNHCYRNVSRFQNYRKFTAHSHIVE